MVQATRLNNLLCPLVDTCGQFRCKWSVCLCVYVTEYGGERERHEMDDEVKILGALEAT
jgi:hypothetical protein